MLRNIPSFLLFCLLASCAQEKGSESLTDNHISIGERQTLYSEVLGEDRPYWVYLPESYDDDNYSLIAYPVLYLLDGDAYFHSATGVVQFMSSVGSFQIPEMIVVAIPNIDRTRDLLPTHSMLDHEGKERSFLETSGGGDRFLQFIEDELQPKIESAYRTRPFNVLVGHSFGGLLATHAVLESKHGFQAYIAIDPSLWWDDRVVVRRAEDLIRAGEQFNGQIYLSMANSVIPGLDQEFYRSPLPDFAELLKSANSSVFRSKLEYFESEDHGSVPLLSLYQGLLFVFDGYKPPLELFFGEPSGLTAHFESVSERLGIAFLPPERLVNIVGYEMLYNEEDVDKAIELFTLNAVNYPDSFNVYDSLAEAYMVRGDKALAISNYEKSLDLNPDNQNAAEQLATLRGTE